MRRLAWVAVFLSSAVALVPASSAQDRGTVRGVVAQVEPQPAEDGPVLFVVTLKGEGVWEARFEVGPDNREAYATVGGLHKGDRVTLAWVREGDRNRIREIRVDGREGEGPAREGERREGEGVKPGPRDGEGTKPGPRDGEPREGATREAEQRAAEARQAEQRAAEERRAAERREVERREGAAREGERREGVRTERRQMKGTVVSVAVTEAEHGEGPRILRVAPLEGGEPVNFTVGADRGKLYETLGELKPGERILVVWVTEAGRPWLVEIGKAE